MNSYASSISSQDSKKSTSSYIPTLRKLSGAFGRKSQSAPRMEAELLEDENTAWGAPKRYGPKPGKRDFAEMLEEENMSWGKPQKSSSRKGKKQQHQVAEMLEEDNQAWV